MNNKEMKNLIKKARKLAKPFRVTDDGFRLKDVDPGDTLEFTSEDKPRAKEALAMGVDLLAELQDMLYAQDRWAVLLMFQAMDAAGKDGAIKHVMSGINPQGCQVFSFKAPTSEDLDHDYLWRCIKCLPERGRIGIFNRSYYEETLVVRVHREFLEKQKLPPELMTKDIWKERFQDIRAFERYLTRNGVAGAQVFSTCLQQRAEEAFSRAHRRAGKKLEVFGQRRQGARALGRLHGSLRRHDPKHSNQERSMVRGARRQQVVYTRCCRRSGDRGSVLSGFKLSKGKRRKIERTGGGKTSVASGQVIAGCLIWIWRSVSAPRSV